MQVQSSNSMNNNVNFGIKIEPEMKFLENMLNLKKIPAFPDANGGSKISATVKSISDIVAEANAKDVIDKRIEATCQAAGFNPTEIIPNYKDLKAQLRFLIENGKLKMKMSSEPTSTNGLPTLGSGKRIAQCYSPSNFGQAGATAEVSMDELGSAWPRKLAENPAIVKESLAELVDKFVISSLRSAMKDK